MENFVNNVISYFATPLDACLIIADAVILAVIVYFLCAFLRKNNATRLIVIFAIVSVIGICVYTLRDKMPATGYICSFAIIIVLFAYFTMFPHEFKRGLRAAKHRTRKARERTPQNTIARTRSCRRPLPK